MSDIIIRAATIADALYILKIYGYYVEKTAVSLNKNI
jgi:L-amino acid N-acyltransferase YncA